MKKQHLLISTFCMLPFIFFGQEGHVSQPGYGITYAGKNAGGSNYGSTVFGESAGQNSNGYANTFIGNATGRNSNSGIIHLLEVRQV